MAGAICARDCEYILQTVGVLAGPHAAGVPAATAAAQAAMAPWSTGRTFVNLHRTPGDVADRARAWTPGVYDRLRQAKRRYDPERPVPVRARGASRLTVVAPMIS